jgi:hypothetical protein
MNPIPEPAELLESECNAQGLYGLPPGAFAPSRRATRAQDAQAPEPDVTGGQPEEPRHD